jgi:hypothetical protein
MGGRYAYILSSTIGTSHMYPTVYVSSRASRRVPLNFYVPLPMLSNVITGPHEVKYQFPLQLVHQTVVNQAEA